MEKHSNRSEKSSISKTSSPKPNRSHSNERRSSSSSTKLDRHRSSSREESKQNISSHPPSNKYDKPKETFVNHSFLLKETLLRRFRFQAKDPHRTNTFDNDRHSTYQNDQRLRHEKEAFERKQYVQNQEEEKIKEQQRRLAAEREQVRVELESKLFAH